MEDYEYLYQANGGLRPRVWTSENADPAARSIGFCPASFLLDPEAFATLRYELGRYVEKSRSDMPYLTAINMRTAGDYYIDFGYPPGGAGPPFTFGGVSWIPSAYDPFNNSIGMGWCSGQIAGPGYVTTPVTGGDMVTNTIMMDAYGGRDQFFFAVASGVYNITVGLGTPGQCTSYIEYIDVMGVVVRNSTGTPCDQGVREYSIVVELTDDMLHTTFGGSSGENHYNPNAMTVMNYMKVEQSPSGTAANSFIQSGGGPLPSPPLRFPSTSGPASGASSPSGTTAAAVAAAAAILPALLIRD